MIADVSPGLILVVGALVVPLLWGRARSVWTIFLPVLALLHLASLPAGEAGQFELMGIELTTLRVDGLSRVFGYAFLVALLLGSIYALHVRDAVQQVAALILAGSAVGAVFAGDLVTLFFYWAGVSVASVFLVWTSRTEAAYRSGMRYLIVQVLGVLLLFEGVLHFHHDYGTVAFGALSLASMGGWMVLLAFGIAAAFPVLHFWLPDAYAKATPTGTVFLSAFTTKLAVYALARGFPGTEMLIAIGAAMVVLGLVLAAIADDLRRIAAYVLISQVGVMVVGVGIGTELALNGVAVFALAHVLTMLLLFMVAGAVIDRAGTDHAPGVRGLYRAMPWTAGFAGIAALSLAAPPFGGFVGHAQIAAAASVEGHGWAWLVLVAGAAGAFALVGLKLVYFAFFGEERDAGAEEAPANMAFAMALAAALSLATGVFPGWVFAMLPYDVTYDPFGVGYLVAHLQLLAFAGLAVVLAVRLRLHPRPGPGTTLDLDWLFRRPGRAAALGALGLGRNARGAALDLLAAGLTALIDRIYRYMGPGGVLARNWPTGAMAFWTTVLLAVWLLAYFV